MRADTFASWVADLVPRRRALGNESLEDAVATGARELLAGGTVAVGDIDSAGRSLAVLQELPLEGVAYREVLGADPGVVNGLAAVAMRPKKKIATSPITTRAPAPRSSSRPTLRNIQ